MSLCNGRYMDHGWLNLKVTKGAGPSERGASDLLEHLAPLDSSKPKAVSICIVITSPTAVALDEGRTSKLFQTGAGGRQGLTRTFGTSAGVLRNKGGRWVRDPLPTHLERAARSQGGARIPLPESRFCLPPVPTVQCAHGTHRCPHCPRPASRTLLRALGTAVLHTAPDISQLLHPTQEMTSPASLELKEMLSSLCIIFETLKPLLTWDMRQQPNCANNFGTNWWEIRLSKENYLG